MILKMGPYFGPLVIAATIALVQGSSAPNEVVPMVAFLCNKPAMHKVVDGWEYDKDTDCLQDRVKILKYCQKLYPNHEITNIVETSQDVVIPWPNKKGLNKHRISVRPFRCVVGQFQSDALLVPQHCSFDHHHNTSVCDLPGNWVTTGSKLCSKRNMSMTSYGMLLVCGVDRFNGVEFVCCPPDKTTKMESHPHHDDDHHDDEDEDEEDDESDEVEEGESDEDVVHPPKVKTMAANKPGLHSDPYHDYLKGVKDDYHNEHERFLSARKEMRKEHQAQMTKLMKEWQAAREHVSELRKSDPKNAEALNHKIADRFTGLYQSYEQQDMAEKKQIVALHQQHVQGDFNKRKRVSMEKYMNALQNKDAHKALKYLRAYYRAEEKDKMHTVNHYQHIKYTEPTEIPRIRKNFQQHIMLIDQRLNQSLQMLSRYPEIESKVKPEIEKFALRYRAVDASAINVILNDAEAAPVVTKEHDVENQSDKDEDEKPGYDPETNEDEHAYEPIHHNLHDDHFIAHMADNRMAVDDNSVQEIAIHGISNQVGSTFGIAIGSVAVFVIIVVAIVMLRRRNYRQPVTHGYVEVDPAASPEERHVANMQMNGYENPTYRYFELSQGTPQTQ